MPKVMLGGAEYDIQPLSIRKADSWRKELAGPFSSIVEAMEQSSQVEINDLTGVADVVRSMAATILASPEIIRELVFKWSPALAADRDRILDEAFDEEIFEAFLICLRLAYPFGGIVRALRGLQRQATSQS